jgi:hypothetical protein
MYMKEVKTFVVQDEHEVIEVCGVRLLVLGWDTPCVFAINRACITVSTPTI